ISVTDLEGASASDSFVMTVIPPNTPPTLDPIASLTLDEDSPPVVVNLTGITAGAPYENQALFITAVSSTPGLIPHPTVNYVSPNTTGTLVLQPVPNMNGSATIVVTVNDGQSSDFLVTRTFSVLVTAINDPPTITSIPNQIVNQNTATAVLPFI